MSITRESELKGMKRAGDAVAVTLREMRHHANPGISTRQLDDFGGRILRKLGARSAPRLTYGFPGWTCISINSEIAHGIPKESKIISEGDLVNIDVSAELDGFWADNGGSFVVGKDIYNHQHLVDTSKDILRKAIQTLRGGMRISDIGRLIETDAKKAGYKVIRNLTGHGIGRGLHEEPLEIANCYDKSNLARFKKNSVIAVETFISTVSTIAVAEKDGWTLVGNKGGFVAQHEHTLVVQDNVPVVLTECNEILN